MPEPQFVFDTEFRLLAFNNAYAGMVEMVSGSRPSIGSPHRWWLFEGADLAAVEHDAERAFEAADQFSSEYTVQVPDAGARRVSIRFTPLDHLDGAGRCLAVARFDITEMDRASRALSESEEQYRLTFDEAPLGIAHIGLDGTFLRANSTLCSVVGYTLDELVTKRFFEITAPEYREHDDEIRRGLMSGAFSRNSVQKEYLRADGTRVWVEVAVSIVRDPAGLPRYFITIVKDISEEIAARDLIAAQASRLRTLADCSQNFARATSDFGALLDSVVHALATEVGDGAQIRLLSEDGQRLDVAAAFDPNPDALRAERMLWDAVPVLVESENPAALVFVSGEPLLLPVRPPERMRALVTPEAWKLIEQYAPHSLIIAQLKDHDEPVGVIGVARHRADAGPYSQDDLSMVRDLADRAGMAISNARLLQRLERANLELEARVQERTEELECMNEELNQINEELTATNDELFAANDALSETNDRLDEATRAKSDFLASMSHELRTPLNAILGFSGILELGIAGPLNEEQTKQISMISESGRHLLKLIENLLDMARIESGRVQLQLSSVDLDQLVHSTVDIVRPLAEAKGLELVCECADDLGVVDTDHTRLEQILLNLLGNAIKFTDCGSVTVTASRQSDEIRFAVKDTGQGISREDLLHLFERFYQGSNRSGGASGTGLGLAVSHELATLLGGRLTAKSEQGRGSEFTLTLPA